MNKIFLALMVLCSTVCFGQNSDRFNAFERKHGIDKIKAYTIIKRPGKHDIVTSEDVLYSRSNIISETSVPPEESLKKYGVKGATIINYKPGTQFVPLSTLLEKGNIPAKDMKLMVYVNNVKYHSEAKNILTVPKVVKSVSIAIDTATKERYIDVRTGAPLGPRKYTILF